MHSRMSMQHHSRAIGLQVVEDHDNLFVMAELIHFVGIGLLAWKLLKKKNAGGEPRPIFTQCCFINQSAL